MKFLESTANTFGKSIGLDPPGGIILTPLIVKYIVWVKSDPLHRSRTIHLPLNDLPVSPSNFHLHVIFGRKGVTKFKVPGWGVTWG